MNGVSRIAGLALAVCLSAVPAWAQLPDPEESTIGAELRLEAERLKHECGSVRRLMGCAMVVATGRPIHLSFGSIAPGNGLAFGASFGARHNPSESWRLTWSGDAVRTFGGSYRAGAYMRMIHTSSPEIVVTGPTDDSSADDLAPRPRTVINLFAQSTSLQDVSLYERDDRASRASFGMRQHQVGAGILAPISSATVTRALNLSISGKIAARTFSIWNGTSGDAPGIYDVFNDASAPGLAEQPNYLEIGGGVRIKPSAGRYLRFNYFLGAQQFAGGEGFSFQRWTVDLDHELAFYGTSRPVDERETNTPNECDTPAGDITCPPGPVSRARRGTLNLRVLGITSSTGDGSRVPFYLQPTLGGRDIDQQATLASFDDYRFRGPHLLLFQQTLEHSVWGPVGAWVRADQGMVAGTRGAIRMNALRKSVAAGVTVRAGGFPMVVASYAVGGGEGRHFSFTINTTLLGGSSRPSLH